VDRGRTPKARGVYHPFKARPKATATRKRNTGRKKSIDRLIEQSVAVAIETNRCNISGFASTATWNSGHL